MQSLALPRPTSLLFTPLGQSSEPEDGLAKLRSKFSPGRPEQQSYPSPPMSEPHSPTRRIAQTSEPVQHPYPAPASIHQRLETGLPLPLPGPGLYSHRPHLSGQGDSHRPPYPGESQWRGPLLHHQPGRSVDPAPYSNVSLEQNYAYGYPSTGVSPYGAANHGNSLAQQTAMIAPPAARLTKPARRTKAHVASACVNCKKAHLSCDVQRPCGRCVASGKQDSCKDVQHKKRGRPRLRDDSQFARPEEGRPQPGQILGAVPGTVSENYAHQNPFPALHHRASDSAGPKGSLLEGHAHPTGAGSSSSTEQSTYARAATSTYHAAPNSAYRPLPIAYLNLDLVIQKSNQAFQDLVSFLGDVRGKHLGEMLEARQNESLTRLRNELRDERDERDPTYMAPITPGGQDPLRPVLESVGDRDVDRVSQGFTDRPMFLSFRLPAGGQYQSLQVQIRLAKSSLYFVTLVVRSPPRLSAPSLLTQQLAPPTPIRGPQTMSAPTTAPVREFAAHKTRPMSSTSSAPNSPYFNFSSVRTSLPTFSPSSYSSSPSYGYPLTSGPDSSYFPTIQPSSVSSGFPSPYTVNVRKPSGAPGSPREGDRASHLGGLQLPPIRAGLAPLGSPLQTAGQSSMDRNLVRRRLSSPHTDERRPETPNTGKRRRLNIHEVLE